MTIREDRVKKDNAQRRNNTATLHEAHKEQRVRTAAT